MRKGVFLCLVFAFSLFRGQEADSIRLLEEKQIEAVELIAQKKLIERKKDRLIFNVEQSVSATGGDVMDILRLTPSVKVENDNISLLGKGNVIVLIDDRPTQMSGSDLANYLRTLKSDEIKSIEVIKIPPAKYSAEGNAGVLNIITKKARNNMWNATLRSTYAQSRYAMGHLGGVFNFRKGKWTMVSAVNYVNGATPGEDYNTVFYPDYTWKTIGNIKNNYNNWSARLGLDYQISEKITNGILYNWGYYNNPQHNQNTTRIFDNQSDELARVILSNGDKEGEANNHIFNYHWIYNIDDFGKKLSFDYDMLFNDNVTNRYYWSDNPMEEGKNWGNQKIDNHTFSIDMEHPLEKINFNYGARFSINRIRSNTKFYDIDDDKEILDLGKSNNFHYRENTQSFYFSIDKDFSEKWEGKVGLRMENTQTFAYSITIGEEYKNHYVRFFPTLYISYQYNDNHSFSLDYGRRISRPRYWLLNPFRWVDSPYAYTQGNPFLSPSYTQNMSINYDYKDWSNTSIYYQYKEKGYEQLPIVDVATNVVGTKSINFFNESIIGLEQTFTLKPIKDYWDMILNFDVSYHKTKSSHPTTLPYLKGWAGYFKITNNISLNSAKTLYLGMDYFLSPKGVDVLDKMEGNSSFNTSIKMLLFKKKMSVNLYAYDIFRSNRPAYISYSNGIKNEYKNYYNQRFIRLSVSYNLGKTFDKKDYLNKNQEEVNRSL